MTLPTPPRRSIDHSPAPLTFGAIGDAYGFCFEFASPDHVSANNDLCYHQHPTFHDVRPGAYSDDTQMHIALGELFARGEEWTEHEIADSFVSCFERDPRPGYAKRFRAFLESVSDGAEFLSRIRPESERNGAAMRAAVVGLLPDVGRVIQLASMQARLTHDTHGGVDSAVAAALASHHSVYDVGSSTLTAFLEAHVPGHDWSPTWTGPVPVHGISTVQAAVTAMHETDSLSEILRRCIAFTGDVDSVATIACACASSDPGIGRDLPEWLWTGLENGTYGFDYLADLDQRVRQALSVR